MGHDPDRMRQQLRVLHRAGGARRRDQPPVRRRRRRGRDARRSRASPRSRCSARTSTATGATCNSRPASAATRPPACARCSPSCCASSAPSTASGVCGSPARTPRTCGRRRSRRWPTRRPCASTCTTRCSPAAIACWPPMHRGYTAERYLERLADARRVVPDLAVSTDIIVGFPGETDDDFERTLEVAAAAEFDYAYTFIFSPRPGTEAATMTDRVRRSGRGRRALRAAASRRRALGAAPSTRRASVASRRCSSRARARRTRRASSGRTRQNKLVHFRPAVPLRTGSYATVEITRAAPHHLARLVRRPRGRADAQAAHPGRRAVTSGPGPPCVAVVGPTASGKSAVAMAVAEQLGDVEMRLDRLDAGLPRHGHRHRQADAGRAGRGPSPPASTSSIRRATSRSPSSETRVRDALRRHRRTRQARDPRRRHRPVPPGRDRRPRPARGVARGPRRARRGRRSPRTRRRSTPASPRSTRSPRRGWSRRTPAASCARSRCAIGSGRPFSSFGPGLDVYPPTPSPSSACAGPRDVLARRIEQRVHAMIDAGLVDEVAALLDAADLAHRPPGARLQGAARPPRRRAARSTQPSSRSSCGTRQFAVRQERWFRRDPRVRWVDIEATIRWPRRCRSCSTHALDA